MKIKLKVDYNEDHKAGSDGDGLPDDLKRKLVKSGLAERVDAKPKTAETAPAKPKTKPKATGRTAARLAEAAPEGHRPLAGQAPPPTPQPDKTPATQDQPEA